MSWSIKEVSRSASYPDHITYLLDQKFLPEMLFFSFLFLYMSKEKKKRIIGITKFIRIAVNRNSAKKAGVLPRIKKNKRKKC